VVGATGKPTVLEAGGWAPKLGYDPGSNSWTYQGVADPGLLLSYGEAVATAGKAYLAGLQPGDLEQQIETQNGPRPLVQRLGVYFVYHKFEHMGEIAALLGC